MRKLVIILLYFTIGLTISNASPSESPDTLGNFYFKKANQFYPQSFDSTFFYLDRSLFFHKKNENWDGITTCYVAQSSMYNYQNNYFSYDSLLNLAIEVASEKLDKENPTSIAVMNSYATKLAQIGYHDKAIKLFQEVLKLDRKEGNQLNIASDLLNLGYAYYGKGDYQEALENYKQAKQIRIEATGRSWRAAVSEIKIGDTYKAMKNYPLALKCYLEAISILEKERKQKEMKNSEMILKSLSTTFLNLAEIALEQKDWYAVKSNVQKSRSLSRSINIFDQGKSDDILGELHLRQGDYKNALKYFFKSKNTVQVVFGAFEKHPDIAKKELKIASVYEQLEDWENALKHNHQALRMVSYGLSLDDIKALPSIDSLSFKMIALDALQKKATCFHQLYLLQKSDDDLNAAYSTYQFALQIIPTIRHDFRNHESKELLSSRVLPLYESAIQLALLFFQKSNDTKYLKEAFHYAEGNKAILLLESINEFSAKSFAGISRDLLEKEKLLRLEIAQYKKLVNEAKQDVTANNSKQIILLERKLFQLESEYHLLIDSFEKNYPKYFQLKHKSHIITVEELQASLHDAKTAVIEYFVGQRDVYVFTITKENIEAYSFVKPPLFEKKIASIRTLISQPPTHQDIIYSYNEYTNLAFELYEKLIASYLPNEIESLIIIPDDVLGLLPFEILLTSKPSADNPSYHLDHLDYLLEEVDISYGFSSTLLQSQLNASGFSSRISFTGFAPSFQEVTLSSTSRTCESDELYSLKCSHDEVNRIQKIWGGRKFLADDANLIKFKTYATQSDIVHLATHACVDDNDHEFNKIYFTDSHLSNSDLYNFSFNSRLVVLSACNTGTGKLVKGEGVMSLSRGFIHAGCPSVVMSLWSVDDCTTSDIMVHYYENLKAENPKHTALRNAKFDFLNSAPKRLQHPYYWAMFVQFGDTESLQGGTFWTWRDLSIVGLIFILSFLILGYIKTTHTRHR